MLDAKKDNIVAWLDLFLTLLLKQAQMAVELLAKEKLEKLLTAKQMAVFNSSMTHNTPRTRTPASVATLRRRASPVRRMPSS